MKATYKQHILNFKVPSGTSRGVLKTKETWYIIIEDKGKRGIGECGILRGLSADDRPDYEAQLRYTCNNIEKGLEVLYKENEEFPSIQFGLEIAFYSLEASNPFEIITSNFTEGKDSISINGLIWMGDKKYMTQQIKQKIDEGFYCLKLKIGALDFQTELDILKDIRKQFETDKIQIRVDANGAFSPKNALEKLKRLSDFNIHSIEQPIKAGQWDQMASLCELSPISVALDEELIGIFKTEDKKRLIDTIQPEFLIIKPSFVGGIKGAATWMNFVKQNGGYYWVTSALESNVGLNAIAQWTYILNNDMPQGLGTGNLFTNNISSPLIVKNGTLQYDKNLNWDFNF